MSGDEEPVRPAELDVPNPRYPEYSTLESRLNSFEEWTTAVVGVTDQTLSEFGFFYIGFGDRVRCFQCGITLRNWEPGDDPLSEHMNWSPDCAFVAAVLLRAGGEAGFHDVPSLGENATEDTCTARPEDRALDGERLGLTVKVAAGDRTVNTSPAGNQRTDTNASESDQTLSAPLATSHSYARNAVSTAASSDPAETGDESTRGEQEQTPTVQAVLDMGYSLDVVNRIREAKRQRDGADFADATSLLRAILDDENQTAMVDSASSSNPSPTQSAPPVSTSTNSANTAAAAPSLLTPAPPAPPVVHGNENGGNEPEAAWEDDEAVLDLRRPQSTGPSLLVPSGCSYSPLDGSVGAFIPLH